MNYYLKEYANPPLVWSAYFETLPLTPVSNWRWWKGLNDAEKNETFTRKVSLKNVDSMGSPNYEFPEKNSLYFILKLEEPQFEEGFLKRGSFVECSRKNSD